MQRVSPSLQPLLQEALVRAYWFKKELRRFLSATLQNDPILNHLDWEATKRESLDQLLSQMFSNQDRYFRSLVDLVLATAEIDDPFWLLEIEDGRDKYEAATRALDRLRQSTGSLRQYMSEQNRDAQEIQKRSQSAASLRVMNDGLSELKSRFVDLTGQPPQERGFGLERLLNSLFELFDLSSRSSFKIYGEQIDGAFSINGLDFLLEAKWTSDLVAVAELDIFSAKVGRKLDNTLGLMLSINGFQKSAVDTYSRRRSAIILMDGSDLMAVLDARVELPKLLERKRRHASQTGEVYFPAAKMLV
jgi:hypothetical protein